MKTPRLDREPMTMPRLDDRTNALWSALLEIAEHFPDDWSLIGGQMVFLHAIEAGADPPRVSRDVDLVVDARVRPPALRRLMAVLHDRGFAPDGASPENVAHRFVRNDVRVDVLVPEGLGPRTDRRTVGSAVTIEVLGGTQALRRTQLVPLTMYEQVGWVPRPDLLGAIVVKAAAVTAEWRDKQRHLLDLAFLCSLVEDPFALQSALDRKDRERLRAVRALDNVDHMAYQALDRPEAARATYRLLTTTPSEGH